jgi:hypothetical protein
MSKIDDLTRLKHIRDSAAEALSFVNNRTREDLDHDRMRLAPDLSPKPIVTLPNQ